MNWLGRLIGKIKRETSKTNGDVKDSDALKTASPFEGLVGVRFGRYSDNNKSQKKTQSWYLAEDRYKERNYAEAFNAFFDYLKDDEEHNVDYQPDGKTFSFTLLQGSKKVHGGSDGEVITAKCPLAVMESPNTAVMRRLLQLNYSLYYSHSAMDKDNTLHMVFISDVASTNPSKLYYGLRELATKADKQDDLLINDFSFLRPTDVDHIKPLDENELQIKYDFFRRWIQDTLNRISELNQDSFSGAIAYQLLALIYRIDFLILPEAKLLGELEKISALYWDKKDDIALVERNKMMKDFVKKLLDLSKEDFAKSVYHSKATFSIATPPKVEKVRDHVISANKDSNWYIENKYQDIAVVINEYGVLYNQFIYSMPRVQSDLIKIYMAVMHADFFSAMGLKESFYNQEKGTFNKGHIVWAVNQALDKYKDKYRDMNWQHDRVEYDSLYDFGISFSEQICNLNLETKRD